MKKSVYLPLIILVTGIAVYLSGCKKDRTEPFVKEVYSSPNAYLDSRKVSEQVFTITGPGNGPIVGEQGTRIYQSKDIFTYPDGTPIDYPYVIKLIELYKPYDMIYYRVFPVSGGLMLTTQGEVRILAEKDGQPLVLAPGNTIGIEFPTDSAMQNMTLFTGTESGGSVDWQNTGQPAYVYVDSSNVNNFFYKFMGDTLGWFNCDKFSGYSNLCTIMFTSETDSLETLFKVAYLPEYSGLMHVGNSLQVPQNTEVRFIAMGQKSDGSMWSFYSQFTAHDFTLEITMEQTDYNQLDQLLTTMFNN